MNFGWFVEITHKKTRSLLVIYQNIFSCGRRSIQVCTGKYCSLKFVLDKDCVKTVSWITEHQEEYLNEPQNRNIRPLCLGKTLHILVGFVLLVFIHLRAHFTLLCNVLKGVDLTIFCTPIYVLILNEV